MKHAIILAALFCALGILGGIHIERAIKPEPPKANVELILTYSALGQEEVRFRCYGKSKAGNKLFIPYIGDTALKEGVTYDGVSSIPVLYRTLSVSQIVTGLNACDALGFTWEPVKDGE